MRVLLNTIVVDPALQSRDSNSQDAIDEYCERMREGDQFPPVDLYSEGGDCYVGDGVHRVLAARQAECQDIEANVHDGGKGAALDCSIGANRGHGLRRTRAGIRKALAMALANPRMQGWTDQAVADHVGVSRCTVNRARNPKLEAEPEVCSNATNSVEPHAVNGTCRVTSVFAILSPAATSGTATVTVIDPGPYAPGNDERGKTRTTTAVAYCPSGNIADSPAPGLFDPATTSVSVANRCPGDDDDPDFVDGPTDPEDEPESDEVFLARMPWIDKLDGIQKMRYTADCLLWRRMEGERKRYVSRLRSEYKLLSRGLRGVESPYFSKQVYRVGRAPGAPQFKLCRDCSGSGTRPFLGSTSCCPTCDSHGYRVG